MLKWWTPWCLVVVVLILAVIALGSYNRLVGLAQGVDAQWAQVESLYQRRADLVPNLVATVQGAANFEKSHAGGGHEGPGQRRPGHVNPATSRTTPPRSPASSRRRTRSPAPCRACWWWPSATPS